MRRSIPSPPEPPSFALDQNFPDPYLLDILTKYSPEVRLRPVREIDERLTRDMPDHRLILALHQLGLDGLLTNDDEMLFLPEVLSMIQQTGLTVVTCRETGDDPIIATGLLLAHLGRVARRTRPGAPQVWRLHAPDRGSVPLKDLIHQAESRSGRRVAQFRLSAGELEKPVLRR